ncbi:hypothetical protein HDU87_006587 [Geranomyces variabilis]|uniref:Uncharacterized protein n=1 Tax=Geranomyces variabilis TaxID=109894 RepID=A0AAD5TF20_9FUNG|nr:hypothetical protein HDU87_006587 [Geranomyces variabilis]
MPPKQGRELPAKESAVFKSILKLYEHKQYKRGLKQADQILKKFPEHGETQAMKGLFLSHLNRKEEGYEFVKKGLRNDLMSHTCWHVYGLMHRADKNYDEAIKCYLNALKFDRENIQIIRDLSLLQMQMRNFEGYNETRLTLLNLRPGVKMYWVGLAVSYHMLQKYDIALNVLSAFEESLKEEGEVVADYERSEMLMYKNLLIEESGDFQKALTHLDEIRGKVVDKRAWKEAKARHLLSLNKLAQAEVEYRQLLDQNADCHGYLEGLLKARGLAGELQGVELEKAQRLMNELGLKYPRSHVIKRTPLKFNKGDNFRRILDDYLQPMFRKGVPSLFVSVKDLHTDSEKAQTVEDVVMAYKENLKASAQFNAKTAGADAEKEPPTAYLWVLYFLAQHFDFKRNTAKALELIDDALAHTPTLVELLMTKARILKHGGDSESAMRIMNEAREIDLQDRFINSKCTKYMLGNGNVAEAEKTITLFTRSESTDPLADLVDMQCMWFALECASSHVRKGETGRALKRLHQIDQHFIDIYDDQFDFHSYSLRKMTLRAYIDLIRVEDRLRGHPFYYQAATTAVKLYLELYDKPNQAGGAGGADSVSEADRKKAERKARKAALKKGTEQQAVAAAETTGGPAPKVVDKDVDGTKFLDADYLDEAEKFVKNLLLMSGDRAESQILGAQVYTRKHKYLLALRSLKRAYAVLSSPSKNSANDSPQLAADLHSAAMEFWKSFNIAKEQKAAEKAAAKTPDAAGSGKPAARQQHPTQSPPIHPTVLAVLKEEIAALFKVDTPSLFNDAFVKTLSASTPERALAAAQNGAPVSVLDRHCSDLKNVSLETAVRIHAGLLAAPIADRARADKFRDTARAAFPTATYFKKE